MLAKKKSLPSPAPRIYSGQSQNWRQGCHKQWLRRYQKLTPALVEAVTLLAGDGGYTPPHLLIIRPYKPWEATPHQSQTPFPHPTLKQLYSPIPKYLPQPNLTYVVDFPFMDETSAEGFLTTCVHAWGWNKLMTLLSICHPEVLIINNIFGHRVPVCAPIVMTPSHIHVALCYGFHRYAVQEVLFFCGKLAHQNHCGKISPLPWIDEA